MIRKNIKTTCIRARSGAVSALLVSVLLGLAACSSGESDDPLEDSGDPMDPAVPAVPGDPADPADPANDSIPTPRWVASYAEGGLTPSRQALIGNDSMALVRSRELDDFEWLTALDPLTGAELWRLRDIDASCAPVITADGNVVVHLEASSAVAGNDSSDDIALIDATNGAILDQWQPGAGSFAACVNGAGTGGGGGGVGNLMLSDSGLVIYSTRGNHRAFRITAQNTIELVWENAELDGFDSYAETRLLGDTLYVIQQFDRSAGDGVKVVYVRRIDANTGQLLATLETTLRSASRLQIAGPDHLAINGIDENADEALFLFNGAGPGSGPNDLAVAWQRVFDANGDGVTSKTSNLALSENAFASWSAIEAGSTVSEFDLSTGLANWSFQTSSFSNNDTIVPLPQGGYLVAPFGGNFVEATSATGELAWRVENVDEANFPQGFATLGADNLVVVSEAPTGDGWVAVGLHTNR